MGRYRTDFVVGEHTDFKFAVTVDHSESRPKVDKLSLRVAWSHHVTHFKFLVHRMEGYALC